MLLEIASPCSGFNEVNDLPFRSLICIPAFETKSNSGVIVKNFNYDKNDIILDGYFEKFNLRLLKFKNYFKEFNFDGEFNSYFKINLNSNLNVEKFNFNILNNSSIIKKVDKKSNQFKLAGLGSFDFEKTKLNLN